jgi:hypothetical protein
MLLLSTFINKKAYWSSSQQKIVNGTRNYENR